jgi:hypothetical protein
LLRNFPALDGDSGKTAGVAVHFCRCAPKPLVNVRQLEDFYAPETADSPRKSGSSSTFGRNFEAFMFERHFIPNPVNEAAFSAAAE